MFTPPFIPQSQELSVRTDAKGGGLTPDVVCGPDHGAAGHGRLILLIHGYDNGVDAARSSYKSFLDNLQKDYEKTRGLLLDVFGLLWPGDKTWSIFSFLSYPLEIGPAKDSAAVLAKYFAGLSGPSGGVIDVYLIAHSLGNRLLMDLLQVFLDGGMPGHVNLKGICLMAAAVPVSMVDQGGYLHPAAAFTTSFTLYSQGDAVLHFAFPLGETAAHDALFPTAVGRFGQPQSLWSFNHQMSHGGKLYGHHDYWTQGDTATPVAQFLDPALPKDPPEAMIPEHLTPPPNDLAENAIPERALPTRPSFG
jgi:alpha/beta hydrolase family protein DUF900